MGRLTTWNPRSIWVKIGFYVVLCVLMALIGRRMRNEEEGLRKVDAEVDRHIEMLDSLKRLRE